MHLRRIISSLASILLWTLAPWAVGVVCGVMLMLHSAPVRIGDGDATLLGAVLGSLIAVGLAAWIPTLQQRARKADVRSAIDAHFGSFGRLLDLVVSEIRQADDHLRFVSILEGGLRRELDIVRRRLPEVIEMLEGSRPLFQELGPVQALAYHDARQGFRSAVELLDEMSSWQRPNLHVDPRLVARAIEELASANSKVQYALFRVSE